MVKKIKFNSGVTQLEECLAVNQEVTGSSPVARAYRSIAQLEEHSVWGRGVAGSNPATPTLSVCGAAW